MHAVAVEIYSTSPLDMATGIGKWLLRSTGPPCIMEQFPPVLLPVSVQSFHDESVNVTTVSSSIVILLSISTLYTGDSFRLTI